MSSPEGDFEDQGCPPHIYVLCGFCGYDVCDDCGIHTVDDEEEDECPALTDTLSSQPQDD